MAKHTPEELAEIGRQKVALFNAVRQYKREFIGNGPPGAVRKPLGHAVSWLMTNWSDDLDNHLRARAIQKMKNRQFISE